MNQPAAVLRFGPDGTGHGLYTEAIDLNRIGRLHIERASHVEFDDATQQWQVIDTRGRRLHQDVSRRACLWWEHSHFDGDDAA